VEERDDLSRDILKVSGVVLSFFLCFLCVGFFGFFMSLSFSASFSLSGFFYFLPLHFFGRPGLCTACCVESQRIHRDDGSSGSHSLSPPRTSTHIHAPRSRLSRGVFKNILSIDDVM